jgi:DNA polymerase I
MGRFTRLPEAVAVTTPAEAQPVLEELRKHKLIALDTETTGLRRGVDQAIILALSTGDNRYAIWPQAMWCFKELLEDPEVKLIMHNANFDQWMLLTVGIDINRNAMVDHYRVYDTMVMHALVNDLVPHDLKSLSWNYLEIEMVPFRKVFGPQLRKRSLTEVLLDEDNHDVVLNYASLDAFSTYHLFMALRDELQKRKTSRGPYHNLWEYYIETELPFTKVLWALERNGVLIDKEALLAEAPKIEKKMVTLSRWFGKETGRMMINLNSNAQLHPLFFDKLKHTPLAYSEKTKAPKLDKAALTHWATGGCIHSRKLLEYRQHKKHLGTYITNLLKRLHRDGRVHASFNQTGARTGRLSSSDPNLQNQPPFIRVAYKPPPGYKLLAADYAQLEMRILAHFSGDETLCNAIINGDDVHSATAAKMYNEPYEEIKIAKDIDDLSVGDPNKRDLTDRERYLLKLRKGAKTINFGLMYGQGPGKLAFALSISLDEAKEAIRLYFETFSSVPDYFETTINIARAKGFCSTLLGRQRLVPGILSHIRMDRSSAERKVKNSPIQGTAADITKLAMLKLWENPYIKACGARMLIQVHDEIVLEVPEHLQHDVEFNKVVRETMERPFDFELLVPLEVSMKYGDNWLEAK